MSMKDDVYKMRQELGKPDPLLHTARTPVGDPKKDAAIARVDASMAARGLVGGDNVPLDEDNRRR